MAGVSPNFSALAEGIVPPVNQASVPPTHSMPLSFPPPVQSYDVHIYFQHTDKEESSFAKSLRNKVVQGFPHLRVGRFHEKPVGPHPIGMFETDVQTSSEFAEFVPWINMNRGNLSILLHPNTGDPVADHTVNAAWFGDKLPINVEFLRWYASQQGKGS